MAGGLDETGSQVPRLYSRHQAGRCLNRLPRGGRSSGCVRAVTAWVTVCLSENTRGTCTGCASVGEEDVKMGGMVS